MSKSKLTELQALAQQYLDLDADYLVLTILGNAKYPEIIVNPRENIQEKVEYISRSYGEDLALKAAPHIKIVKYEFLTAAQLRDYF
ncbi:hypothetical protein HWC53_gp115 [Bacillus phage vB_BmeM-Goe8]|uniref:Uncharacterized protein n=1 Tax=Bacillus phage vB_BmeM-Goe8 TaxID=2593638 RepID=A0A516KN06_9CAUD|nr:hypothetical protein HWC53_gp115 [Bacillus phage vB_BmeM-Goe8]QDP42974.1 hypothetical protein Goe8_c02010 [Bacillus phage vB_BmeM-Goe8]